MSMSTDTLWLVITIVGAVGACVCGLGLRSLHQRLKAVDEHFQSPQLRFRYTANESAAQLDTLGEGGRLLMHRFSLLMIPMMLEVLLVLLAVSRNASQFAWLRAAMFIASGLISLSGIVETLLLRFEKHQPASVCSLLKWGAFALWTLGMFAGLFIQSTKF